MPRARDPNAEQAQRLYVESNGEMSLKDIGEQLGISDGTIRGWKSRYKWDAKLNVTLQTNECNVTNETQRYKRPKDRSKPPPRDEDELTDKQRMFVKEYLIDLNATQAAIRAGYSANTAEQQGSRLLSNVKVQTSVQEALDKREQRTEITADRVLQELAKIGFANMTDYAEWGPKGVKLKDSTQLTAYQAAAVAEVSETVTESGGSLKFKLHNKIAALERIGKHLGMFDTQADKDKVDPNAQITALADLINNPAPERVLDGD